MKVLIVLCLATLALAEERRFILGDLKDFADCEKLLQRDPCNACCDTKFSGFLGSLEKGACHAACRILPAKRQLVGEAIKFAHCETELHKASCKQCCDDTFHGIMGFAESTACHASCDILPSKRSAGGDALKIAQCELKASRSECESCCGSSFHGIIGFAEKELCNLGCSKLHG
eukprot:GHVL01033537.1.p1 GENE.GHVL01033537.1~~GHVL01033537.1.p1  ORF type:complete len:174 (-),score=13.10 GHVL01033537.1:103-624(-)